jgi:CRP-like cAMP-binding protein
MKSEITLTNLTNFLKNTPGFKNLDLQDMERLIAPIISIATYEPGQKIIERGEDGHTVFFLYRGRTRVDLRFAGQEDRHFFIEQGEIFGEMALVSREKRSADVVAVSEVICFTIDIETFQNLMSNYWRITKAVASLIGSRRIDRLAAVG